jgi:hypothetical protein
MQMFAILVKISLGVHRNTSIYAITHKYVSIRNLVRQLKLVLRQSGETLLVNIIKMIVRGAIEP